MFVVAKLARPTILKSRVDVILGGGMDGYCFVKNCKRTYFDEEEDRFNFSGVFVIIRIVRAK